MTGEKCEMIKDRLFKGNNKIMGDALGVSDVKIGLICRNQQTFAVQSIEKLLIDFKIDPEWFFRGEAGSEVVFVGESTLEKKYYSIVEKLNTLQEELVGYQKKEIWELRNPSTSSGQAPDFGSAQSSDGKDVKNE